MERLEFKDDKGVMIVYDTEVHIIYTDEKEVSRKYPLYADYPSGNSKIMHDCLKIINLGGYLINDEALEKFDRIIDGYMADEVLED